MSHTQRAFENDPTDAAEMIWSFELDLVTWFGRAPGQQEAFELLVQHLGTDADGDMIYMALIGFGLALTETAEERAKVEEAASFFLVKQ